MRSPNERPGAFEGAEGPRESIPGQNAGDRLRRTTEALSSIELVSAFAGDRAMTGTEEDLVRRHREERGDLFFSDLLHAISHHHFAGEVAEPLWREIVSHKQRLSDAVGRNVRVTVATLDYLSNITGELRGMTLISEAYVSELASLAMRDRMTGLFNHTTCHELLDLELKNHRRNGVGMCLLLLDIDDFKEINDDAGYQEGDRVLVELARTLVEEARAADICCRLGGDEFVIILRLTSDQREGRKMAQRIRASAAKITGNGSPLSISVGVALADRDTTSPRSLLGKAGRALREAKSNGKNRVVIGRVT